MPTSFHLLQLGPLTGHVVFQPDLVYRLKNNLPALKGDRSKYYTYEDPVGYTDYPFADGSVSPARYKLYSQPYSDLERASL